jgi:hypothetical protein
LLLASKVKSRTVSVMSVKADFDNYPRTSLGIYRDNRMKVTEKPIRPSVGVGYVALAVMSAILILPGANGSEAPFLYVCIVGGLFVGIPAVLGIAIVYEHLHRRTRSGITQWL